MFARNSIHLSGSVALVCAEQKYCMQKVNRAMCQDYVYEHTEAHVHLEWLTDVNNPLKKNLGYYLTIPFPEILQDS